MTKYLRSIKEKLEINDAKDIQTAEILAERRSRFLLVIRARWAIMGAYMVYGLIAALWIYFQNRPDYSVDFTIYAWGLVVLAAYNGVLHFSYEHLSRLKGLAQTQMVADVLITTVIIHFTGGVASWFWPVYLLIILQSAFLFDRKVETMVIAFLCGLLFGLLTIFEYSGLVPIYFVPFISDGHASSISYSSLKVMWVFTSSFTVALIASYPLGLIRNRQRYLANISIADGLTGLYNHSYFYKRLTSELERAKRYKRNLSLILIDLDDLKQYNDTYGHQAGDKLLKAVADTLRENIRSNDIDTVYRLGGDEFAIIAPETGTEYEVFKPAGATAIAKRIRNKVKENLPTSVSVGISSFPHHGNDVSNVFKAADFALYKAKAKGKDCIVYSSRKLIIQKLKNA